MLCIVAMLILSVFVDAATPPPDAVDEGPSFSAPAVIHSHKLTDATPAINVAPAIVAPPPILQAYQSAGWISPIELAGPIPTPLRC